MSGAVTATDSAGLSRCSDLIQRRVPVVPVRPVGRSILDEWQRLRISVEDVPTYFGNGQERRHLYGDPSGHVDVDLDCPRLSPWRSVLADHGKDPRANGASPGRTDGIFRLRSRTTQYRDIDKSCWWKLRSTGGQTHHPPAAIHPVRWFAWDVDGRPRRGGAARLQTRSAQVALRPWWLATGPLLGSRHDRRMP